jgi:hypothetical protein
MTLNYFQSFTLGLSLFATMSFAEQTQNMTPTEFFHGLNKNTMHLVNKFYASDAVLRDPVGEVRVVERIKAYYAHQYAGAEEISWEIEPEVISGSQVIIAWKMNLKVASLNGGKAFTVPGMSRIFLNEKGQATLHEDYFDVGAFIYERVPVLKNLIAYIKGQLKKGVQNFDSRAKQ